MDNVAILIPITIKHYDYIYNFIEATSTIIDIYLIFSNQDEYEKFNMKDKINKIIIPDNNTGCIVTYKKFYALQYYFLNNKKYDYVIVCDAEIDIISQNYNKLNIIKKIKDIFYNKIIYCSQFNDILSDYNKITLNSSNIFINNDDCLKLKNITNNYTLYYWWSNLPIYCVNHLDDFFKKITYDNINIHCFDHMVYINYLLLYQNFTILNINTFFPKIQNLELLCTNDFYALEYLKSINYGFSFVIPEFYYYQKNFLISNGCFLLFHLDRYKFIYNKIKIIENTNINKYDIIDCIDINNFDTNTINFKNIFDLLKYINDDSKNINMISINLNTLSSYFKSNDENIFDYTNVINKFKKIDNNFITLKLKNY